MCVKYTRSSLWCKGFPSEMWVVAGRGMQHREVLGVGHCSHINPRLSVQRNSRLLLTSQPTKREESKNATKEVSKNAHERLQTGNAEVQEPRHGDVLDDVVKRPRLSVRAAERRGIRAGSRVTAGAAAAAAGATSRAETEISS